MTSVVVAMKNLFDSRSAIEWGMRFAEDHSVPVEVVHVVDARLGHTPGHAIEAALLIAEEELRDLAYLARLRFPRVQVETRALIGTPARELANCVSPSGLLVLGAHQPRHDAPHGRTMRVVQGAPSTVVIVPTPSASSLGVVVGVTDSPESRVAVQFGARLAHDRKEPLTLVHATGAKPTPEAAPDYVANAAMLADLVAALGKQFDGLEIRIRTIDATPAHALRSASIGARTLVIGSRSEKDRGTLGPVAESAVSQLPCTVVVTRGGVEA